MRATRGGWIRDDEGNDSVGDGRRLEGVTSTVEAAASGYGGGSGVHECMCAC